MACSHVLRGVISNIFPNIFKQFTPILQLRKGCEGGVVSTPQIVKLDNYNPVKQLHSLKEDQEKYLGHCHLRFFFFEDFRQNPEILVCFKVLSEDLRIEEKPLITNIIIKFSSMGTISKNTYLFLTFSYGR